MSFGRLLLVAAILEVSNGMPNPSCQYGQIRQCNLGLVAGLNANPNIPNLITSAYCDIVQRFADCLSSSAQCKGELIDSLRFMAHQHMIMDKTLELCPHNNLEALKKIVQADAKYRQHIEDLPSADEDDFALCAANEHAKCITGALQEMEKRVKMCFSAQHFIECYTSPNESCSAKICTDFVNLEKTLDSRLLEMFKESPGVMPGC